MLTLLQIKATSKVDQVNLVMSDKQVVPFPIDFLFAFGLTKGMEIDEALLSKITSRSISFILTNYTLRLIAMAPQTSVTIERKSRIYLSKYLFKHQLALSREEQRFLIDEVLNNLQAKGLINDQEFIKYLVNKLKGKSQQDILYRLKNAGIDINSIDDDVFEARDETSIIQNLVLKKVRNLDDLADPNTKNKVMSYLVRKGFPYNIVKTVIDEIQNNR